VEEVIPGLTLPGVIISKVDIPHQVCIVQRGVDGALAEHWFNHCAGHGLIQKQFFMNELYQWAFHGQFLLIRRTCLRLRKQFSHKLLVVIWILSWGNDATIKDFNPGHLNFQTGQQRSAIVSLESTEIKT